MTRYFFKIIYDHRIPNINNYWADWVIGFKDTYLKDIQISIATHTPVYCVDASHLWIYADTAHYLGVISVKDECQENISLCTSTRYKGKYKILSFKHEGMYRYGEIPKHIQQYILSHMETLDGPMLNTLNTLFGVFDYEACPSFSMDGYCLHMIGQIWGDSKIKEILTNNMLKKVDGVVIRIVIDLYGIDEAQSYLERMTELDWHTIETLHRYFGPSITKHYIKKLPLVQHVYTEQTLRLLYGDNYANKIL